MSREDRCKAYAAKPKGLQGGADQASLDQWATRASKNSEIAPRASRKLDLPSTGKQTALRDTDGAPFRSRSVDARMKAQDDMNIAGDTSYLPTVRRNA